MAFEQKVFIRTASGISDVYVKRCHAFFKAVLECRETNTKFRGLVFPYVLKLLPNADKGLLLTSIRFGLLQIVVLTIDLIFLRLSADVANMKAFLHKQQTDCDRVEGYSYSLLALL